MSGTHIRVDMMVPTDAIHSASCISYVGNDNDRQFCIMNVEHLSYGLA